MRNRLVIGICFAVFVSLVISILVYTPAEAGRVPLPGGWEVELVYCTDGFYATAITPTDREGPDGNRHTVILSAIDLPAASVGPIADFTWIDGFPTVTSYFRWAAPQTAGTPVNATLDRLQNGTSMTDAEGRVDTDVVQECQLPLLTDSQPGTPIVFGEPQLGELSGPDGLFYAYEGTAGELVAFEALGVGGISPTVTLIGSGAELLHSVNGNGGSNLSFTATLPATGSYTILVGEATGIAGQFTLNLSEGSPPAIALTDPSQTPGTLNPATSVMNYSFPTKPDGPTRIEIQSLTDGFSPDVTISTLTGDVVASLSNGRVSSAVYNFGPNGETLELSIGIGGFTGDAAYLIIIGEGGVVEAPPETGDDSEEPATTAGCTVTTDNDIVNVRSGGSTNHPVVGSLTSSDSVPATGFNAANQGWYEITLPDGTVGWISTTVTTATGSECANLPVKNYPAAPAPPPPTAVPPTSAPPPPGGGDGTPEVLED